MRPLHPRQSDILQIAKRDGRVDVETLASHFDVTPQTIRKDLNDLCEIDALQRVHGGAVHPSNTANFAYQSRRELAADSKQGIGERAAGLIADNSSVILNIGTTTEQVAFALKRHQGLMAITNNLNVATILADAPDVEVVVAGGTVRKTDGGIVGAVAIDLIRQFKVDFAVIGASAIDEDGCLLDFDYREVQVAQAILEQARTRVLVADVMKFERRAPVQIGHLADIDVFVTDAMPPDGILEICQTHKVQLEIVKPDASAPLQFAAGKP